MDEDGRGPRTVLASLNVSQLPSKQQMGSTGPPRLPVPHRVCWPCLEHTGHGDQKLPGGAAVSGGTGSWWDHPNRRKPGDLVVCLWQDGRWCVCGGGVHPLGGVGGGVGPWQEGRRCVRGGAGGSVRPWGAEAACILGRM